MGYYAIEKRTLQDIADAIRFKDGTTDPIYGWDLGARVWRLEEDGVISNGDDFSPNNTSTAKYVCDEWNLQDIADAIRYLEDTSAPIPVSEMARRIAHLNVGALMWTDTGEYAVDVYYGNGLWVAAGGGLLYSTNGWSWTEAPDTRRNSFVCVHYADGIWVAVGDVCFMYSEDGKNWYDCSYPNNGDNMIWYAYYANGVWVAVGDDIWYSEDGKTWRYGTGVNHSFSRVCYGNGVWVAVSSSSIAYSEDGKTWTYSLGPNASMAGSLKDVCYGNGVFVLVGDGKGVRYSTDGKNWLTAIRDSSLGFYGVYYANGLWVTAAENGSYYSEDGKTWTIGSSEDFIGLPSFFHYGNGVWVAGGKYVDGLIASADGKTWTQSNVTEGSFSSAHYANGTWVAAGEDGIYYSY